MKNFSLVEDFAVCRRVSRPSIWSFKKVRLLGDSTPGAEALNPMPVEKTRVPQAPFLTDHAENKVPCHCYE